MIKKWIQAMHLKKGALHRQLGVKTSQNIPSSKISAASEKGGTLGRRARLAKTLIKLARRKKK